MALVHELGLTITNILLGLTVVVCLAALAVQALNCLHVKRKKARTISRELDRDMREYFGKK